MDKNNDFDFSNIFIEIQVEISFLTKFLFGYYNEFHEEKIIELNSRTYSREIYYRDSSIDFSCMLFIYNMHFEEEQTAQIRLFHNKKLIEKKLFHLSNTQPYDGWFILEKKISNI